MPPVSRTGVTGGVEGGEAGVIGLLSFGDDPSSILVGTVLCEPHVLRCFKKIAGVGGGEVQMKANE